MDGRKARARRIEDLFDTEAGTLARCVLNHFADLEMRGYSKHTIRGRTSHLRRFLSWCAEREIHRPEEVTAKVIQRYQRHLFHAHKADGHRLTFRSQNGHLSTVKLFFRWLLRQGVIEHSPAAALQLPKIERRLPKAVLSRAEAERVLGQPDISEPVGVRDRAILEVLYSTGIRRQELLDLAVWDVDVEEATLMVRQGKGKRDRMIPLGARAAAWVDKYIDQVRPELVIEPDDGLVFRSFKHRQVLSGGALSTIVRRHVEATDLGKTGSCHLFRHTCATLMLEGGADIRFIQAMLGHADVSTTQIYTRVALRQLKAVHAATHPGSRLGRNELDSP